MTTPTRRWSGEGRRVSIMLTSAMLVLGGGTAMPGVATAAVPSAVGRAASVATHEQAVSSAERQAVLDYWTSARLAALNEPLSANPPTSGPDGAPWTRSNAVVQTVGRLFFTSRGEDSSCTATVVDSANRSTVVTAGHCVHSTDLLGENGEWATQVMFVPGYSAGRAPYGRFVGRVAVVDSAWTRNDGQDPTFDSYDQAFVVLNKNERGRRVQDAVGAAQSVGFDVPGAQRVVQFGYPRSASDPAREGLAEYTGRRLAYCAGRAWEHPGTADWPTPKGQWGAACVMGGGSSGGPRMAGFDPLSGLGSVVGVNTWADYFDATHEVCESDNETCTRHLIGPQFTSAITRPLYDRAQRAGTGNS
ncbi:trypsin-like serine peptidase [Micromonospora sp. NPDC051543]|uniref:trypsin-like serine peptidase n=1 Tax=Micromonospora sp. NPDC051543 TaxID=3364287 RepID=UPI00378C3C98